MAMTPSLSLGVRTIKNMKKVLLTTLLFLFLSADAFCLAPQSSLNVEVIPEIFLVKVSKQSNSISGTFEYRGEIINIRLAINRKEFKPMGVDITFDIYRDEVYVGCLWCPILPDYNLVSTQIEITKKRNRNETLSLALLKVFLISEGLDGIIVNPWGFNETGEGQGSKRVFYRTFPDGIVATPPRLKNFLQANNIKLWYPKAIDISN